MVRGLYTSAWGMIANSKKMDTISNNLANVNTNAYKRDEIVFESFPDVLTKRINDTRSKLDPNAVPGNMQLGSDVGEVFTYYKQGSILTTNNRTDLAFKNSDNAFFTVGIPDESGELQEYYTRDGAFTLNAEKQLADKDGNLVLGQNGPITLSSDDFIVEDDGTVIQNGQIVDKLLIKEFADTKTLRKFGSNLVTTTDETEEQEFSGQVKQGALEQSNVNTVKEMVNMISVMRSYEASQKLLQIHDGVLQKTVTEVGAVR
ncbi:MAG: flagellar hook-basal body protein [Clostridia bacterium]|nr:flagellar hook-basal body protein [Clostridia bacterium]